MDEDLILSNPLARQGIQFLMESGVLLEQRLRLIERLAAGDSREADEDLLKRIKEYRIQSGFVETLLGLGEQIKGEENQNEPR